jgi:hypothetical protein
MRDDLPLNCHREPLLRGDLPFSLNEIKNHPRRARLEALHTSSQKKLVVRPIRHHAINQSKLILKITF